MAGGQPLIWTSAEIWKEGMGHFRPPGPLGLAATNRREYTRAVATGVVKQAIIMWACSGAHACVPYQRKGIHWMLRRARVLLLAVDRLQHSHGGVLGVWVIIVRVLSPPEIAGDDAGLRIEAARAAARSKARVGVGGGEYGARMDPSRCSRYFFRGSLEARRSAYT